MRTYNDRGQIRRRAYDDIKKHRAPAPSSPEAPGNACGACKGRGVRARDDGELGWCMTCGGSGLPRSDAENPAPDPRTPGQVAFEARFEDSGDMAPWAQQRAEYRADWDRVAAAVLAHGRGNK